MAKDDEVLLFLREREEAGGRLLAGCVQEIEPKKAEERLPAWQV